MMEIKPPRLHTGISSSSLACPCRPITGMMARAKALVTVTVSGAAAKLPGHFFQTLTGALMQPGTAWGDGKVPPLTTRMEGFPD